MKKEKKQATNSEFYHLHISYLWNITLCFCINFIDHLI